MSNNSFLLIYYKMTFPSLINLAFGILINDTLTWSDHVDLICSKVNRALSLLRTLSWFLPHTLLLINLYCDVVWSGCTQEESHRLESLLNYGCKIVLCRRRDSSSTVALQDLGLTTLTSRRKLHTAQCMFCYLSSQSPSYLPISALLLSFL